MKFIKLMLGVVVVISFLLATLAFSTVEITAPTTITYLESTSVNVSCGINITGFPYLRSYNLNSSNATINVTILTKTTSSGAYSILAASLPLTIDINNGSGVNGHFWNYSATLPVGRNYVQCNFTNVSRAADGTFGGALTAERIVQIDTEPVLINFSGNLHLENYNLSINSGGGTRYDCGPNDSGAWSCS